MNFINPVCPSVQKAISRIHKFVKFCTEIFTAICQIFSIYCVEIPDNLHKVLLKLMVSLAFIFIHN